MCKCIMKNKMKTIKVSEKNWSKLMKWRIDFGCKNMDEIIEKILNIIPAIQLKKEEKK